MKLPVDDDLADARALMYRPNVIWHVYNDMHDRKEHAEIFWRDDNNQFALDCCCTLQRTRLVALKINLY